MRLFLCVLLLLLSPTFSWGGVDLQASSNDEVTCSDTSSQITGVFSVGAWVRFESKTTDLYDQIFTKEYDGSSEPLAFRYDLSGTDQLHCGSYNGTEYALEYSYSFNLAQWYHVACTCETGNIWRLFIDGTNVATSGDLGSCIVADASNADYNIGNNADQSRDFDGVIEDLFFDGNTWTPAQIANIASSRVKRMPLQYSPDHYWPLDEVANGVSIAGATLYDMGSIPRNCSGSGDGYATVLTYP